MKRSVHRNSSADSVSPHRSESRRILGGAVVLVWALLGARGHSVAYAGANELPDARTWRFFSEKKLKPRLFFAVPGAADSIRVSDDPACCPVIAPNGRWVACVNWNG